MKFETDRTFQQTTGRTPQQTKGLDIMNTNETRTSSPAARRDKTRLNKLTAALTAAAFAVLSLATLFHAENAHADGVECEAERVEYTKYVFYAEDDYEEVGTGHEECDHDAGKAEDHSNHDCECSSSSSSDSGYSSPPSNWAGYWVDSGYYKPISYSGSTTSGSDDESNGCGSCSGCDSCDDENDCGTSENKPEEKMCGDESCSSSETSPDCSSCFDKTNIPEDDEEDENHKWCCGEGNDDEYCGDSKECNTKCGNDECVDSGDVVPTSTGRERGSAQLAGGGAEAEVRGRDLNRFKRKIIKAVKWYIKKSRKNIRKWCEKHPNACAFCIGAAAGVTANIVCEICEAIIRSWTGKAPLQEMPDAPLRHDRYYALHEQGASYYTV